MGLLLTLFVHSPSFEITIEFYNKRWSIIPQASGAGIQTHAFSIRYKSLTTTTRRSSFASPKFIVGLSGKESRIKEIFAYLMIYKVVSDFLNSLLHDQQPRSLTSSFSRFSLSLSLSRTLIGSISRHTTHIIKYALPVHSLSLSLSYSLFEQPTPSQASVTQQKYKHEIEFYVHFSCLFSSFQNTKKY